MQAVLVHCWLAAILTAAALTRFSGVLIGVADGDTNTFFKTARQNALDIRGSIFRAKAAIRQASEKTDGRSQVCPTATFL
jgi:hypothetical protein